MIKYFGLFTLILFVWSTSTAQKPKGTYQVGQHVEAYNVGWYKATVLEIGAGKYEGYIKVHYNDFSSASDQYLAITSIRNLKKPAALNFSAGPRNGRYIIMSYGGRNPLTIGYFDLNGGKYTYYNAGVKPIGKGSFQYDAENKRVVWQTGSLKEYAPNAAFEISREGKTHNIRLRSNTIGTNSTD